MQCTDGIHVIPSYLLYKQTSSLIKYIKQNTGNFFKIW